MKTQYPLIVYEFTKQAIEQLDYQHFLATFGADKLPDGPQLKGMMGRLAFAIKGYEHDPRDLIAIEEVRRFYTSLNTVWPFWLYFGDLSVQHTLQVPYLCRLKSLTLKRVDGNPYCELRFARQEILGLLWQDFPHLNRLARRAGLSEQQLHRRGRAVFGFFQLPFGD
jgi:hypothetical protein